MRNPSMRMLVFLTAVIGLGAAGLQGEVSLPAIIGDSMVLQRDIAAPIWGWADPGEEVTVTIAGQEHTVLADADGKWMVRLDSLPAGGPMEMTISGKNTLRLENILVGEVWLCSGQSNMAWPVRMAGNAEEEIARANHPRIRLFTVKRAIARQPKRDSRGAWEVCSPETVAKFSAVGYYFGRDIQGALDVPVGLINSSVGGTCVEAWTRREVMEGDPSYQERLNWWREQVEAYDAEAAEAAYLRRMEKWRRRAEQLKAEGKEVPRKPRRKFNPTEDRNHPSVLYNGMIAPLVPYGIRGAIWYQGESNIDRAYLYRKWFPNMIADWRGLWGQGDFPFLYVQLANFRHRPHPPFQSKLAELREAQTMSLTVPATAMAVTIDVGDLDNIHPSNKQDVGRRLALAARKIAYGQDVVYSGPIYRCMQVEDGAMRIHFTHADGGLVSRDNQPLTGFGIAGEDREFHPAEARIEEGAIVVRSEDVPQPVAVRYGWANSPECNLYNGFGLPASPFRTDGWPGLTDETR